jgi:Ca-activated chloride channel family protein
MRLLVTIVTYAGEAGLQLTPTRGDRKRAIHDVVNSLNANGSTNGEGGIQLAYEMARRSFLEGGANRVILCTDGDFNVGVHNESDLKQLIEKERASRVFLTVLGFGMGTATATMRTSTPSTRRERCSWSRAGRSCASRRT